MSQQHMISFKSDTDKLEAITHIVNKLLHESGGDLMLQHARTQTLEKLQDLDADGDIDSFDGGDFDDIVENSGQFTVNEGNFGQQTITNVRTVGSRPTWLGMPDSSGGSVQDNGIEMDALQSAGSGSDADFSELESVTDHQPEALKEAGFKTFRDLYEADESELTDVPGVTGSVAENIKEEAGEHIDPLNEIAKEAYEAEMEDHEDDNGAYDSGDVADAHLVTDVQIPAGKPRGPEYDDTIERRTVYGLPVLEYPTLTFDLLEEFCEESENLTEFVEAFRPLIKYDIQYEGFRDAVGEEFDSLDELENAVSHPRNKDAIEPLMEQVGVGEDTLSDAIEVHDDVSVTPDTVIDVSNDIDLLLEDEVPVKARLEILEAIRRELNHDSDVKDLLDDTTLEDIIAASEAPIELDHPFIEDLDNFPPLKTRKLETGERDVEAAARIVAKNNYALDLIGHAGVGKDTLLKFLAAATNRPMIVINMDESMISQDLMGIHKIDESGKVIFKDGVIPHAAKHGYWLVISEVNAAAPEILTAFHQLLEQDAKLHVKERDEVIEPLNKFRLSTTRNPPGTEYDGAKELNGAFKRRLNSIWLSYLDTEDEVDLIDAMKNSDRKIISEDDIKILVNIASEMRESAEKSRQHPRISTSKILHIIDLYDGAGDLLGATKESIKASLGPMERENEEGIMNAVEDHF